MGNEFGAVEALWSQFEGVMAPQQGKGHANDGEKDGDEDEDGSDVGSEEHDREDDERETQERREKRDGGKQATSGRKGGGG